jgi:valyl-tRNA synthetase
MLDKYFDFNQKESEIYKKWEEAGCFLVENTGGEKPDEAPVFDITMPPPNANGEMHLGHCYGHTLMDIMGRYRRLRGDRVMLVPGKDHAGIQTQVVFERKLREEGVEVEKMPREEFWQRCYDFCTDRAGYMRAQEKMMGTSADFSREIFTLDPRVSEVVYETFFRMWKDGLVYRGSRMVHWSVYSQTSISDVEVEYKEEKGHLWHIRYPLLDKTEKPRRQRIKMEQLGSVEMVRNAGNHWLLIGEKNGEAAVSPKVGEAVIKIDLVDGVEIERDFIVFNIEEFQAGKTKPELLTRFNEQIRERILGSEKDLQIVEVVPDLDDEENIVVATTRPETMLGDTAVAVHPKDQRYTHLVGKKIRVPIINRDIAIIADDRIDISFGTGAVKVTPAHDFTDNEIGHDHKLEEIQVIDKFGQMTEAAGEKYQGLTIGQCREKLIKDLEEAGLLILTEEITHKVPIAERGKDIVEPLISTQWFINVDKEGLSLKKRALELVNSGRIKVYPARMKDLIVQWLENLRDWNISRQILWGHRLPVWYKDKDTTAEQIHVGKEAPDSSGWIQETDTFDTWFSSGQWPYSTLASLGFLDLENPSVSDFFPTHTMLMGRDILFFWACRMLLFSAYRLNDVPWKNIYFTGLIRDAKGQKMSKSKGNGIEPKEMLQKYGADALRAGLLAGSTAGLDVKFNEKKVDSYAKFLNKIWNAAKLVAMKGEGDYKLPLSDYSGLKLNSSKWILGQLLEVQKEFRKRMDNYEFSTSLELIYHFSWDIFCSWYLEIAKVELELASEHTAEIKAVMFRSFEGILQMLHPFMPFFTEEIHESLERFGSGKLLASQQFVKITGFEDKLYAEAGLEIQKMTDLVTACREVRKTLGKGFTEKLTLCPDFSVSAGSLELAQKIGLAEFTDLEGQTAIVKPYSAGKVMIACSAEEKATFRESLVNTLSKKEQEFGVLEKILTPGFKAKADPDLVAEREAQFEQTKTEVETLRKELQLN